MYDVNCSNWFEYLFLLTFTTVSVNSAEKVREKSRACHNHKPQPCPDTKRKRKQTKPNKRKSNKRTISIKISSLSYPSEVIAMLHVKGLKKTQEQNSTKKLREESGGVPQSQTAALPRHQEEDESDKSKQAQIEQTYEKH